MAGLLFHQGLSVSCYCEWFQESCVECSCAGVEALQSRMPTTGILEGGVF